MKISVVIPVYNGSKSIEELTTAVLAELSAYTVELILVNDGSKDDSESVCEKIAAANKKIKFISLRKNFGEHNAVMCGLHYSTGDYVVIIDDDFQNPPSEIIKLVTEAQKGFDVVYSRYTKKKHHLFRNIGSSFTNMVATFLLDKPKSLYLSSFKAIHQDIVKEILKYNGPSPYVDGLILRATNNFSTVLVEHTKRDKGRSNYTFRKLFSLYLNMFLGFSVKPLRIFTIVGFLSFCLGFTLSIVFAIEKLCHPEIAVGWTSSVIITLTFSGVQLIFLGMIGEYVGKMLINQNKTPQWVVKKEILNDK